MLFRVGVAVPEAFDRFQLLEHFLAQARYEIQRDIHKAQRGQSAQGREGFQDQRFHAALPGRHGRAAARDAASDDDHVIKAHDRQLFCRRFDALTGFFQIDHFCSFLRNALSVLHLDDCFGCAVLRAVSALNTFLLIDLRAVLFEHDRADRAFRFAHAAECAPLFDYIRHQTPPFSVLIVGQKIRSGYCKIYTKY